LRWAKKRIIPPRMSAAAIAIPAMAPVDTEVDEEDEDEEDPGLDVLLVGAT